MYLRTAALVLLACLALTVAAEDAKTSDVPTAQINHYAPQPYGYGSCARRRQQYQEQYGSSEEPYGHHEHHEHNEGYEEEQRHHREHSNDGYAAAAAAQGKGVDAKQEKHDAKATNSESGADTKASADAAVPARLLSSGIKPAVGQHDFYGNSLEHLLHQQTPHGHYFQPGGLGAHMFPGYNDLLEDGMTCLNDWSCCSNKCSDNVCCHADRLYSGQTCVENINCCSGNCVAQNPATPLVKTCCKIGGAANGVACTTSAQCCSNNCLNPGLAALTTSICCPPGTQGNKGVCTSSADCCGSDRVGGAFCNGLGPGGGRCCNGLIADGKGTCTVNEDCCSNICDIPNGRCLA